MCSKPDPTDYLTPINRLDHEFSEWENPVFPTLAWAGVRAYLGILENA